MFSKPIDPSEHIPRLALSALPRATSWIPVSARSSGGPPPRARGMSAAAADQTGFPLLN